MEHYSTTQYHLMWMKSKFPSSFNISPATFQEPQGGFPWPPRSYTCTFCRREFRSAQALGGHMNVHRRDRARLKQSSPPQKAESEFLRRQKQPSDSYHEPVALENSLDRRNLQVPPSIFTPIMNSEEVSADLNRRRSGKPGFRVDDNDEDFIETKLSMGLDLVDHETNVVCKRHKTCNGVSPLPFLHMKLCSSERCSTSSSMEDIDLELRLGDPPAVK